VTTIPLIPSVLRPLLDRQKMRKTDISSLALITSGAAYLSADLETQLNNLKTKLIVSQGTCLVSLIVTRTE
jgi:hypothetical protein